MVIKNIFMLRKLLFCCFLFLVVSKDNLILAQSFGFELAEHKDVEAIPFEYINGFIVVEVLFNQTFPLKFIVDTGASNTIISKKEIISLFNLPYGRTFKIYGADLSTVLYAHLVNAVHLSLNNLIAPRQDILVLEEDYFDFQRITGIDIHGVLGADMFRYNVLKINYKNRTLELYKPTSKRLRLKKYTELDMVIQKSKPYIVAKTELSNNKILETKLLIDTGASTALLLDTNSDESLTLPSNIIPGTLGFGLGGNLQGYIGRVPSLEFGKFKLEDVICRFQEVEADTIQNLIVRNGIIGNYILDRFIMVIDYHEQRLYLKPERRWKRKFRYDKSGINFISIGLTEKTYYVNSVLDGSPADLAGVQIGDVIKTINRKPSSLISFNGINRILHAKAGKKVRLKIKRGDEFLKTEFRLKDLI